MKKRSYILAAIAVVLTLAAFIGMASAFFTTYARTKGYQPVNQWERTEIMEPKLVEWTKHIVIRSAEGSEPCYIRAKAISGVTYPLDYTLGEGWSGPDEEGWYYYAPIVNAEGETTELLAHIGGIPEEAAAGVELNVIVVSECTPVLYTEDGTAYADWSMKVSTYDNSNTEGGND